MPAIIKPLNIFSTTFIPQTIELDTMLHNERSKMLTQYNKIANHIFDSTGEDTSSLHLQDLLQGNSFSTPRFTTLWDLNLCDPLSKAVYLKDCGCTSLR